MSKIYVAGPMFSQAELQFNEILADHLESLGHEIFLPQRSGFRMKDRYPHSHSRLQQSYD